MTVRVVTRFNHLARVLKFSSFMFSCVECPPAIHSCVLATQNELNAICVQVQPVNISVTEHHRPNESGKKMLKSHFFPWVNTSCGESGGGEVSRGIADSSCFPVTAYQEDSAWQVSTFPSPDI